VAGFERELEGLGKEERPFLAAVDPTELEAYYKTMRNPSEELDIKITEILSIALELAAGKEMPNIPGIKYDEARRMAVFLPKAEPVDYDKELKARYDARLKALESA
jgi:hypothetical protein